MTTTSKPTRKTLEKRIAQAHEDLGIAKTMAFEQVAAGERHLATLAVALDNAHPVVQEMYRTALHDLESAQADARALGWRHSLATGGLVRA